VIIEPDPDDQSAGSADVEGEQVVEEVRLDLLEKLRDGNAKWEVGQIPEALRYEVLDRDKSTCRFCGRFTDAPALHHIRYRSEGGLNHADNLITVHWMYAPRCHERIHDRKRVWQPIGLYVATRPGLTMLQVARWQIAKRR
jgi:hypothetical protein